MRVQVFYTRRVMPNLWLLGVMGMSLLFQELTFTLKFGWAAALGLALIGLGLGHALAPTLRADGRRVGLFLFNLAAVLWSFVVDGPTTDGLCLFTAAVIVATLWDEEGPHLKRRFRAAWRRTSRFARPVTALPAD